LIAKLLERIGDHAERIARTYPTFAEGRLEPKLIKEMDAARESAMAILDKAFTALLTADIDAANEAVDDLARHQKLIDGLSHHVATRKGEELLALRQSWTASAGPPTTPRTLRRSRSNGWSPKTERSGPPSGRRAGDPSAVSPSRGAESSRLV